MAEEMESSGIFKVEVLTAMKPFQRIWNLLLATIISNCWNHNGLLGVTNVSGTEVIDPSASCERGEVQDLLEKVVSRTVSIIVEDILNPEDEHQCIDQVADEVLVEHVLQDIDDHDHSESVAE